MAHYQHTYTAQQNLGSRLSWTPAPDYGVRVCLLVGDNSNKGGSLNAAELQMLRSSINVSMFA
ncbi:MAG TPA: hypothetical protein VN698_09605 [Bacteroidia bacterium]|nr:hypothetical protein [Bacteroidia bacterium]